MRIRRLGAVIVAMVSMVALSSCLGPNRIDREDARELENRIRQEIPQTQEISVHVGGHFGVQDTISVNFRTDYILDIGTGRAQVRKAAKIAWLYGNARAHRIDISLKQTSAGQRDCDQPVKLPCRYVSLQLPSNAAQRLWGDAETGGRDSYKSGETFAFGRHESDNKEYAPRGWSVDSSMIFDPVTEVEAAAPLGVNQEDLRAGADRIAAAFWRDHPDRIQTLRVYIAQNADVFPANIDPSALPEHRPVLTVDYSSEQLLARFGPRAADLAE